jgi:hypothetical protein
MSTDEKPTSLVEENAVDRDIDKIEDAAQAFNNLLTHFAQGYRAGGQELEQAKINLQQAVMWAVKGLIR